MGKTIDKSPLSLTPSLYTTLPPLLPPLLPSLKKMHKSGTNTQMGILRSYGGEYRNFSIWNSQLWTRFLVLSPRQWGNSSFCYYSEEGRNRYCTYSIVLRRQNKNRVSVFITTFFRLKSNFYTKTFYFFTPVFQSKQHYYSRVKYLQLMDPQRIWYDLLSATAWCLEFVPENNSGIIEGEDVLVSILGLVLLLLSLLPAVEVLALLLLQALKLLPEPALLTTHSNPPHNTTHTPNIGGSRAIH